jgi:hypothetical protein
MGGTRTRRRLSRSTATAGAGGCQAAAELDVAGINCPDPDEARQALEQREESAQDQHGEYGRQEVKRQQDMHTPTEAIVPGMAGADARAGGGRPLTGSDAIHDERPRFVDPQAIWPPDRDLGRGHIRADLPGQFDGRSRPEGRAAASYPIPSLFFGFNRPRPAPISILTLHAYFEQVWGADRAIKFACPGRVSPIKRRESGLAAKDDFIARLSG